jgi:hypothetical protein
MMRLFDAAAMGTMEKQLIAADSAKQDTMLKEVRRNISPAYMKLITIRAWDGRPTWTETRADGKHYATAEGTTRGHCVSRMRAHT